MPADRPIPPDELATIRRLAEQERVRHGVEGGDVGAHTLSLAALDLIETVERLTSERDKFKSACAELDKAITWHTSCLRCSSLLDASYAETCRAEQAEQQRDDALAEVERLRIEQHTDLVPRVLYDEAIRLRDQAIAHDRQPYPTAWAYEQACKTIERMRPVVRAVQEWRDQFARPSTSDMPRKRAVCDAVDVYEADMEAIATGIPADEHPERVCRRCGGPNVRAWCAPSPLWNQVMRGGDINAADRFDGIVCPVCFAALAEEAGIAERWMFYAERVKVELAKVTPSGRVWNEKTWLWEEPDGTGS